ncbi:MAG: bifunctional phosphopantothenoylcysteine decarboxylase/phosphopantothenate--cysteine ligase CoaBC [Chloroflexota bacterium]
MELERGERTGRNVILGVTGSIAAFKAVELASRLVQTGHVVRVILTPGATHFVTPLSFEAITGHHARVSVWDDTDSESAMGHLDLARWGEVMMVAPASAGAIARLALGLGEDMLGAVALAFEGDLIVAPAMESAMYRHDATQKHLATLSERGAVVIGPAEGRLASGATGVGRMASIGDLVAALSNDGDLSGKRVVITAGPTHEAIDPVRFIGNRSSGKMGYALAAAAGRRGAEVLLISGPVHLTPPAGVALVNVESAEQMRDAVLAALPGSFALVMAAAVGDFRPERVSSDKLKRQSRHVNLEPTVDIAAEAASKFPDAIHAGFALETADLLAAAQKKLAAKGQDLVVANALDETNMPFGRDTNRATLVTAEGFRELPLMSKSALAGFIWDEIAKLAARRTSPSS